MYKNLEELKDDICERCPEYHGQLPCCEKCIIKLVEEKVKPTIRMQPERRCSLFNCVRRRGNVCCADCGYQDKCKEKCQNSPQRCGCTTYTKIKAANSQRNKIVAI